MRGVFRLKQSVSGELYFERRCELNLLNYADAQEDGFDDDPLFEDEESDANEDDLEYEDGGVDDPFEDDDEDEFEDEGFDD